MAIVHHVAVKVTGDSRPAITVTSLAKIPAAAPSSSPTPDVPNCAAFQPAVLEALRASSSDASPSNPAYAPSYEPQGSDESTNSSAVCQALDAEVKAINERTRHRYTNPEGEYYRDRLHKISDRKYDLHFAAVWVTTRITMSPAVWEWRHAFHG